MRERPIIFSAEMIRALLEGRKTMTRRALKLGNKFPESAIKFATRFEYEDGLWYACSELSLRVKGIKCPYGIPGDRLWVREVFAHWEGGIVYKADKASTGQCDQYGHFTPDEDDFNDVDRLKLWESPIYMRRLDSRFNLEIKDIRVERIQDISEEDAKAEGCDNSKHGYMKMPNGDLITITNKGIFRVLWNRIHEKDGFKWEKNPFCWVIKFNNVS